MELFKTAGKGRHTNDSNNKKREDFLIGLYHTTEPSHQVMRSKWMSFLSTLYTDAYDDVCLEKRGGRGANYDFDIRFLLNGVVVHEVKAEFKHNASTISKLPQYLSIAADRYMPTLYADFYYDFLDRICDVYPGLLQHKPTKEIYLKLIHNSGYDRHPFFRSLYDMELAGTPAQTKQKQQIVRESIRLYLEEYANSFNLRQFADDIRERQTEKVFVMWNLSEFVVDSIRADELEITHVEKVKNNNTIILMSKSGSRHKLLLRWKNHLGVLFPAWQISLTR